MPVNVRVRYGIGLATRPRRWYMVASPGAHCAPHVSSTQGIFLVNKAELIDQVAIAADISKAVAARALDAVLDGIAGSLKDSEQVVLVGFGTFVVKARAARVGRNPRTGEPINISAARIPTFRPGKALRDNING